MADALGYYDPLTEHNAWGLTHITNAAELKNFDAWLMLKDGCLYLEQSKQPNLPPISLDFTSGRTAHRLKQIKHTKLPLAKACGLIKNQRPTIIDATSGMAQDGLLLAAMGSSVTLVEQHPLVYALVADAFSRARNVNLSWLNPIIDNISHISANSCDYLAENNAEVVYLDPMYPERSGQGGQVKKAMQILRSLSDCYTDSAALLDAARRAATQRVVVKRPAWADHLANLTPDAIVSMPNHNFDIYLN